VSVTEIASREGDFERTPPHDLAAEQCVLGGMLMSKDAISDVMEVIRPADHYRPAHQLVHEAILELYGRGEPADPVTVSDLLAKRGELVRVGGGAYLHTLIASVPTAANAGYYARIVRERAILRRLVEVGTRIVQLGYAGDGDRRAGGPRAGRGLWRHRAPGHRGLPAPVGDHARRAGRDRGDRLARRRDDRSSDRLR
jgi:replicative DNA helicase